MQGIEHYVRLRDRSSLFSYTNAFLPCTALYVLRAVYPDRFFEKLSNTRVVVATDHFVGFSAAGSNPIIQRSYRCCLESSPWNRCWDEEIFMDSSKLFELHSHHPRNSLSLHSNLDGVKQQHPRSGAALNQAELSFLPASQPCSSSFTPTSALLQVLYNRSSSHLKLASLVRHHQNLPLAIDISGRHSSLVSLHLCLHGCIYIGALC